MPDTVVIDSGPCIALFDRDDRHHEAALQFMRGNSARLASTLAVITEVLFVLDFNIRAQIDFLSWVRSGAVQLVETETSDFDRVIYLMQKYADLPMDFTDGLLVAICERLGTKRIVTVDRDFTIYRYNNRGKFENMFPLATSH